MFVYIYHYSEKYKCYAVVSMSLMFVCSPIHLNKNIVTFIKLGTIDVKITTLWRFCCLCYNVRDSLSVKETEKLFNFCCPIKKVQ